MSASYGLVEVTGNSAAVDCLNAMSRAANVRLVTWEKRFGGKLVTLIVQGTASDVTSAVQAAKRVCEDNQHELKMGGIIPNPDIETEERVLHCSVRMLKSKRE